MRLDRAPSIHLRTVSSLDVTALAGGDPLADRAPRLALAAVRVLLALLWMQGAGWKNPQSFGRSSGFFYDFVAGGTEHEVFAPYGWLTEHVLLPHFTLFAWLVLLTEIALAAFLLVGLATRFWALVGVVQSVAILLSVANTPGEWGWSYWLMIAAHLAVWATAAGRWYGLDGLLRPAWLTSGGRAGRLLARAS